MNESMDQSAPSAKIPESLLVAQRSLGPLNDQDSEYFTENQGKLAVLPVLGNLVVLFFVKLVVGRYLFLVDNPC